MRSWRCLFQLPKHFDGGGVSASNNRKGLRVMKYLTFWPLVILAVGLICKNAACAEAPAVVPAVEKGDEFSGPKTQPPALPKEFAFVFSLP